MATHSSILAWRIPGTGEPGGLPSMGSHSRTLLKRLSSSSSSISYWLRIYERLFHNIFHMHITFQNLKKNNSSYCWVVDYKRIFFSGYLYKSKFSLRNLYFTTDFQKHNVYFLNPWTWEMYVSLIFYWFIHVNPYKSKPNNTIFQVVSIHLTLCVLWSLQVRFLCPNA